MQILVGADLTRAAQLIGHERWTGKDYYVTAIIHGRTLESGAVLQIVDPESSEVFVAEVISVKKDKDNKIIEGNPDKIKFVTDSWKFTKNINSKSPNWYLSEIISQ